jgi:hypothetical protein
MTTAPDHVALVHRSLPPSMRSTVRRETSRRLCQELVAAAPVVVSASPDELDEAGWALRRELVDRESHISLLALTN